MISTVLVVDDSQVERDKMSKILQKAGYSVKTAENGQIAVDAVKAERPDLIMMDINMPVMDGFAATRTLRSDAETKDVPVIFVTSKGQRADKAWGKMLGAKGYITKPYGEADVIRIVDEIK